MNIQGDPYIKKGILEIKPIKKEQHFCYSQNVSSDHFSFGSGTKASTLVATI